GNRSEVVIVEYFTTVGTQLYFTRLCHQKVACFQIFFLVTSYGTVYLMFFKFRATYDRSHDTFRIEFLIIPAIALAFLINHHFSFMEIAWSFSLYLEAVAIMPQLFMLSRTGSAETITAHYLFALGAYRALYVLNWIYRYYTVGYLDPIPAVAGVLQTVLYADFFYLYVTRVIRGRGNLELPA
ncbi:unnamed protein product, partial [Onchocerca flexuosa]|uniref:ER lumen protein-retaining receptor n=2 Tax=Onchocerca flexuosa TaxID=387005 RepID=A0A183I256_9BILA